MMTSMRLADKAMVHQVHPVKIGAYVTASVISNTLLWTGRPKAAIAVRLLLPVQARWPYSRWLTLTRSL
jgi:hypothetical protein